MPSRLTTVVSQAAGLLMLAGSERLQRTHASCTTSSASLTDPNSRYERPSGPGRSAAKIWSGSGMGSLLQMGHRSTSGDLGAGRAGVGEMAAPTNPVTGDVHAVDVQRVDSGPASQASPSGSGIAVGHDEAMQ